MPDAPHRMGDERMAEIRARCDAATRAPWFWRGQRGSAGYDLGAYCDGGPSEGSGSVICVDGPDELLDYGSVRGVQECDEEFIAHARTDVPDLLDDLDALRAELAEARATLDVVQSEIRTAIKWWETGAEPSVAMAALKRFAVLDEAPVSEKETAKVEDDPALYDFALDDEGPPLHFTLDGQPTDKEPG